MCRHKWLVVIAAVSAPLLLMNGCASPRSSAAVEHQIGESVVLVGVGSEPLPHLVQQLVHYKLKEVFPDV